MDFLASVLTHDGYLTSGYRMAWSAPILWTRVSSDLMIATGCFCLLWALRGIFRRSSPELPRILAWLVGACLLSLGASHALKVGNVWFANDLLQAFAQAVAAVALSATAVTLCATYPRLARMPTPGQLRSSIASLEAEVRKHRSAEEDLERVEQSLAVTLESIGAGFIATDADGRVTRMNTVAEQLCGWTQREASGTILWHVLVREGRKEADTRLNPVDVMLRDAITVDLARRFVAVSRTGKRTEIEAKAALTRAADGTPRGIAIVVRNLTDALAGAEATARLAAIVDSSGDAIIGKTLEGRITSWNPGAERLFGYPAAEAIGQSMQMLIPPDRANEETDILDRIARGLSVEHFETVRRRRDGSLVDVSASISPVRDSDGKVVGASKIARDVTERKQADRRLLAQLQRLRLLDQITQAIGERLDVASIFQVAVRSLADELPADLCCVMTHDADSRGMRVTTIGHASTRPPLEVSEVIPIDGNGLSRCLRGELVYEPQCDVVDFPFPRRMAAAGMLSLVIAPLRSEGQVFGVFLAARRQAAAFGSGECEFVRQLGAHVALAARQARLHGELQSAFDELSRSQQTALQHERLRALGQMASGIAHDINNAITPAILYAENILENEPLSDQARVRMQSIAQAVDDVASTVARLREFYRSGEARLSLQPVALNVLVTQVIELSRARWSDMPQRRGVVIAVATDLAPLLPAIDGVESEIRDALINLVFNAIDAMPEGGSLTLRTLAPRPAGSDEAHGTGWVAVEVADTGSGMDEETRLRCLEPFFTTKGERGTGLGLAMVYGTAKRHGARIEIVSRPGHGTTVSLRFKFGAPKTVAPPPAFTAPALAPLDILLVDDDPALLRSLSDTLQAEGYTVQTADGGRTGIDAFAAAVAQGRPHDVVFTDLGMPYVDGRAVAAAIKRLSPRTPVILLTGWGQRMAEDGEQPANVDVMLSKPPRLHDIREGLARCLAQGAAP